MIGTIPNPKKTFQIEQPANYIKLAIEHFPLFSTEYNLLKANPALNLFTFEASEFLSLGVYIDINYFTINDSRTEVAIEIRRKIGSFDKSHEVSLANRHIAKITDLISESISTDPNIRIAKFDNLEADKKRKTDEFKQEVDEKKRKAEEERKNNPFLYYTKQALLIILSVGLIGGTVFILYKVL